MRFSSDKQRRAMFASLTRGKGRIPVIRSRTVEARQKPPSGARRRSLTPPRRMLSSTAPTHQAFVLANQGLLHKVARRFRHMVTSYEDLIGAGQIGLIHAAKGYKPKKGKFSTFAVPHIQSRMQRAIAAEKTVKVGEKGLRKHKRAGSKGILPFAVSLEDAQHLSTSGGIPAAHARASLASIRKRAEKLPMKLRNVFVARFYTDGHARLEPWTTRQVAKKLKISLGSVSKYEKQARQRLFHLPTSIRRRSKVM